MHAPFILLIETKDGGTIFISPELKEDEDYAKQLNQCVTLLPEYKKTIQAFPAPGSTLTGKLGTVKQLQCKSCGKQTSHILGREESIDPSYNLYHQYYYLCTGCNSGLPFAREKI